MSGAILRYLAVANGFYPTDPEEVYEVEKLLDLIGDYVAGNIKLHYTKDEDEKKKLLEEYLENFFPKYLGYFDKQLQNNSSKEFMVGDKITIVDFLMLHRLERIANNDFLKEPVGAILDTFPTLKEYYEIRYEAQKEYFENRPVCPY